VAAELLGNWDGDDLKGLLRRKTTWENGKKEREGGLKEEKLPGGGMGEEKKVCWIGYFEEKRVKQEREKREEGGISGRKRKG